MKKFAISNHLNKLVKALLSSNDRHKLLTVENKTTTQRLIKKSLNVVENVDRKYLVYCPVGNRNFKPELFGPHRLFDVAINNYQGEDMETPAEYFFKEKGVQKLYGAYYNLPKIEKEYAIYAFIDDDIEVSTEDLNRLFVIGDTCNLDLYQPALTLESHGSYSHTFMRKESFVRKTHLVEMMVPFFSRAALDLCLPSFNKNLSGFGLDFFVWPDLLKDKCMTIIDNIPVQHMRPVQSGNKVFSNRKTSMAEFKDIEREYKNKKL